MKRLEDHIQTGCVSYFRYAYPNLAKCLTSFAAGFVFAGDNTKRAIVGKRMKDMGYQNGSPDLVLWRASNGYHGLFIEIKTPTGRQTAAQKEFEKNAINNGYEYIIVRSVYMFEKEIEEYLK